MAKFALHFKFRAIPSYYFVILGSYFSTYASNLICHSSVCLNGNW